MSSTSERALRNVAALDDRYRLVGKIGSGGMAEVFLAVQSGEASFKQLVVVKRIHSEGLQFSNATQMFVDEARTIASLSHPHIVKIFDLARLEGDICIAMEYVHGENLAYLFRTLRETHQVMPPRIVCKLVVEACEALHYAHSAQSPKGDPLHLIHRDICLQNMLLDASGYLKIIDFGIAKTTVQSHLSSPHHFKGKLSYVAPEVLRRQPFDHRIDLYALGLVCYELLTLERPFPIGPRSTPGEVLKLVSTSAVPPPSERAKGIGPKLDAAVLQATTKEPTQRFTSGADMAQAVRAAAEEFGGLASTAETHAWYQQTFASRIKLRRQLERRAMDLAAMAQTELETLLVRTGEAKTGTRVPVLSIDQPTGITPGRRRAIMLAVGVGTACALALGQWWLSRIGTDRTSAPIATAPVVPADPTVRGAPPVPVPAVELPEGDFDELVGATGAERQRARPRPRPQRQRPTKAASERPAPLSPAPPPLEVEAPASAPPTPQPAPVAAPPSTPAPEVPRWLSKSGDWSGARVAKEGCGHCHGHDAPALRWDSKTRRQWDYFFDRKRHRKADLERSFSPAELARVRQYIAGQLEEDETSGVAGVK